MSLTMIILAGPVYFRLLEKTGKTGGVVKAIGKAGADFKQQFTYSNYRAFFEKAGYRKIETELIQGRVPCAVAIITK